MSKCPQFAEKLDYLNSLLHPFLEINLQISRFEQPEKDGIYDFLLALPFDSERVDDELGLIDELISRFLYNLSRLEPGDRKKAVVHARSIIEFLETQRHLTWNNIFLFLGNIHTDYYESYFNFLVKSTQENLSARVDFDFNFFFHIAVSYFDWIMRFEISPTNFLDFFLMLSNDDRAVFYEMMKTNKYIYQFFTALKDFKPTPEQLLSVWFRIRILEKIDAACSQLDQILELTPRRLSFFIRSYFFDEEKNELAVTHMSSRFCDVFHSIRTLKFLNDAQEIPRFENETSAFDYVKLYYFTTLGISANQLMQLHRTRLDIFISLYNHVNMATFSFWLALKNNIQLDDLFYRVLLCCHLHSIKKITAIFSYYENEGLSYGMTMTVDTCVTALSEMLKTPVCIMPDSINSALMTVGDRAFFLVQQSVCHSPADCDSDSDDKPGPVARL